MILVFRKDLCSDKEKVIRLKLFLRSIVLNFFIIFVWEFFIFLLGDMVKGFFIVRLLKNVCCFLLLVGGSYKILIIMLFFVFLLVIFIGFF